MFDAEQVAKTTQRYESRTTERAGTEARIEAGVILEADTPERIHSRLVRKGIDPELAAEVLVADEATGVPARMSPRLVNTLERLIGKDDLINANFLTDGARASRAVCRIEIGEPSGLVAGYGTGVMVSPRLVLTNNHVLDSAQAAAASQAEFGYEDDAEGQLRPSVRFALEPNALFLTDPELDFTLVAVRTTSPEGQDLREFGWVPLIEQQGKVIKGEYVNIIQHPNGEPKRVALRENQIVDLLENFLHYKTDTAPGSSGAPVFNDEWEMVALHHSGVPARDANDNILASDGSVWSEEMGEHRVKWIANEGARVSRLMARLRQQRLSEVQRLLLEEAFAGNGRGAPVEPSGSGNRRVGIVRQSSTPDTETSGSGTTDDGSTVAADGTVTWTIPLQVSIRLGAPMLGLVAIAPGPAATRVVTAASRDVGASSSRLSEALAELERGRARPYYSQSADESARDEYYPGLPALTTSAAFYSALNDLLTRTHTSPPRYEPSRHVYPWVDLRPNRKLRSIYTGEDYEPEELIQEDFRVDEARAERMRERLGAEADLTAAQERETLDLLEALLPYNCEHVVPQSW